MSAVAVTAAEREIARRHGPCTCRSECKAHTDGGCGYCAHAYPAWPCPAQVVETTLPSVLNDEDGDRIERLAKRREKLDAEWRDAIRQAVANGASLREVAARAGISHTAVKFIAHGRPEK